MRAQRPWISLALVGVLSWCGACSGQASGPDPEAAQALESGLAALDAGNTRNAMADLARAAELDPDWVEAWASLNAAAWIAHDPDQLVRSARWLLEHEQGTWRVAERMAEAALGSGMYAEAQEAVDWLSADRPRAPGTRLIEARLAFEKGELDRAGNKARQASQAAQPEAEAFHILGRVAEERGNGAAAVEAYESALELNPGHQGARDALALLHSRRGREQEAARHRELHARVADALGRHFRSRPAAERRAQFEPLVEELPSWRLGRIELASALLDLEEWNAAKAHLNEALARDPENSRAHQLMGQLLSSRGNPNAAALHFERARALGPAR